MSVTGRDIDKIYHAIRARLGSLGSTSAPSTVATIAPHTHSSDQVTHEGSGLIAADDVQEAIEELDSEKLARDGTQTMLGNLDMNSNQIANILNLLLTGGVGDGVISGARVIHGAGDDSDGEALFDGFERITFNSEVTKSLIEVLSRTKWNIAVIPGTDYTPAEGDVSWSGVDGIE
ncbi:hypothetical protein LCGC14_3112840, partial [marine sediment metagenome]